MIPVHVEIQVQIQVQLVVPIHLAQAIQHRVRNDTIRHEIEKALGDA